MDATAGAGPPGWARAIILGGSALALLLIGATVGLLIGRSETPTQAVATPGPVDIGFSQDMSLHHRQAVEMGNLAYVRSDDTEISQIGFDIAATQQGQVGSMQGWLALWEAPGQAPGEVMSWMPHDGGSGDAHDSHGSMDHAMGAGDAVMPGMATSEEMRKLRSLSGEKFDVYFLQLMVRHHEGGVPMAEYAVEHAKVPAVRALARSILESQGAEIELMKKMLETRGAKPLPF
ncbi:MAG: DUF305 domain-containing protein [Actinophytocola sp.]|nr:DUF305 domain-containing protein [Actinophytocola sp.]